MKQENSPQFDRVSLIELLESRFLLEAVQTLWQDQGNHLFSDAQNWSAGVPFDGVNFYGAIKGDMIQFATNPRPNLGPAAERHFQAAVGGLE